MKYIVVLGDGMADRPVPELGGKTPLQVAKKPNIDALAREGEVGTVRTVPEGMPPASDVANLSVMGYDPSLYYTGRSPLEAVSIGIDLAPDDIAYRCNLVTLSDEADYGDKTMVDYCAEEIDTEEARELIEAIDRRLGDGRDGIRFHVGISYRHCMVWKGGPERCSLTPPHDIPLASIRGHLPRGETNRRILGMMRESYSILDGHPINRDRKGRGLRPANSIWLWGEGRKPALPSFREKYGLSGAVISAVDLLKGLGLCAGMKSIDVAGATGNINTNYAGKTDAALRELSDGGDFVYLHIEAPDECGHRHEVENKVKAIELIDELVVGRLLASLDGSSEAYRLLVMPDHPTPLSIRTHSADPVPFLIYEKNGNRGDSPRVSGYDEFEAQKTGLFIERGHELMDRFLTR